MTTPHEAPPVAMTETLCGSTYHGHKCERPAGHQSDTSLLDREVCRANWGGSWLDWRYKQPPPAAPEEAVRLVEELDVAASLFRPVLECKYVGEYAIAKRNRDEARTALLNYIAAQVNKYDAVKTAFAPFMRDNEQLADTVAALTAEKEAMQRIVDEAREIGEGPHSEICKGRCGMCRAMQALDALTPKPPTDTTEERDA